MAIDCPGQDSKSFPTRALGKGVGFLAEPDSRIDADVRFARSQVDQQAEAKKWLDSQTCKKSGCQKGSECVVEGKITITIQTAPIIPIVKYSPKGSGFDTATCKITGSVDATAFCKCVTHAEAEKIREAKKAAKKGKLAVG